MNKIILILSLFAFLDLYADDQKSPLIETQNFLKDPEQVKQETQTNNKARAADKVAEITALGQKEHKQEIYNISADLMPWLEEQTKGDVTKMQALILEAQKNPEAFYSRLPASEKAKIKALSEAIDSNRTKNKNP